MLQLGPNQGHSPEANLAPVIVADPECRSERPALQIDAVPQSLQSVCHGAVRHVWVAGDPRLNSDIDVTGRRGFLAGERVVQGAQRLGVRIVLLDDLEQGLVHLQDDDAHQSTIDEFLRARHNFQLDTCPRDMVVKPKAIGVIVQMGPVQAATAANQPTKSYSMYKTSHLPLREDVSISQRSRS